MCLRGRLGCLPSPGSLNVQASYIDLRAACFSTAPQQDWAFPGASASWGRSTGSQHPVFSCVNDEDEVGLAE